MRFRALLSLQLLTALIALACFVTYVAHVIWVRFGSLLPTSITYADVNISVHSLFIAYSACIIFVTAVVFLILFLLLDRMILAPIRAITSAMQAFTETRMYQPLMHVAVPTIEIRELVNVFAKFADGVEQVHKKDIEMSRVKSDFISTAAHQLRTPLTGIRWALEALLKEQLTEDQKALVENAVSKSHDLVAIVGTLLDISSIESGKHKYTFKPVDIGHLVTEVVNDFSIQAGERKVLLTLETPEAMPLVRADQDQIKWVLNNLVENAIRYTPEGGRVRITFAHAPDRVQVLVSDTGIGITPKDRNNIFERFYRAENAVAKENKGNGLGLYIARTIATDHGGDLNFTPNPSGPGTTFTLSLPESHR